ncbi:hypothetical protein EJ08DRAFT_677646 [Tothia fuscella]|uniref:Methyltransferase type 12 domain-containing protein n=1 Tax=Tothia fuscella TaxID=1048955 RepID=A0A9P4NVG7_9PEZI|nr:hypothetical protein EJ08DRAFT_677646 [Tothia fuscella]
MTEPSLHSTFDTSLIDTSPRLLQDESSNVDDTTSTITDSFSTTDTAPSDDYNAAIASLSKNPTLPLPTNTTQFAAASTTKAKLPVKYVSTVDAYDAWAEVYDTDGNILQSMDDYELLTLLPEFFAAIDEGFKKERGCDGEDVRIVDFGCGTGRNTVKILETECWESQKLELVGIDASKAMLTIAGEKLKKTRTSLNGNIRQNRTFHLLHHDFLNPTNALASPILLPQHHQHKPFNAAISTLVLEHFPLRTFFAILSSLLLPSGIALITNMHPEMGAQSQAGFVSTNSEGVAVKVRGASWVHGVEETVQAARREGFEVVGGSGGVRERGVDEGMVNRGVVGERGGKWVGKKVWYGMVLRKRAIILHFNKKPVKLLS